MSRIQRLPNQLYWFNATWTWDGALEVYGTAVPINTGPYPVQVHLWSNGADHVLYTVPAIPGGIESRCRFIQDQNARIDQQGSGNADALPLAPR